VLPVRSKDFDDGSNDHENLHSPKRRLPAEAVNRPVANKQNGNESASIDT
jgi:hypothetical protein